MARFPNFREQPYYAALRNWLSVVLNEDGTLKDEAVESAVHAVVPGEVTAQLAADSTVKDAAAAAVDNEIAGRELVEGKRVPDDEVAGAITDAAGRMSWLATTQAGRPPAHTKAILAADLHTPEEVPDGWGWAFALTDRDDRIAFGIRNDGSVFPDAGRGPDDPGATITPLIDRLEPNRGLQVRDPSGTVRPYTSTPRRVAFWGDSMIEGQPRPPFATDGSDSVPGVFATLHPGGTVYNGGKSGQVTDEVAIRQGGLVLTLTVAGGAIPASGAVAVSTDQVFTWKDTQGYYPTGTLAGVHGQLTRLPGETTLTFTRTAAGTAVPVTGAVPFVPDQAATYADGIQVILTGRNDVNMVVESGVATWDVVDRTVAGIAAMVGRLTPLHPRVLICGPLTARDEPRGSLGHTLITEINRTLAAMYPASYWDLRRWLIDEAMDVLGLTPTGADQANIDADTLPPSLLVDRLHYTPATAAAVAQQIHDEMTERGWL